MFVQERGGLSIILHFFKSGLEICLQERRNYNNLTDVILRTSCVCIIQKVRLKYISKNGYKKCSGTPKTLIVFNLLMNDII